VYDTRGYQLMPKLTGVQLGNSGQVVQFRVDDLLAAQLSAVSARLHTPIGVLARQWVAERIAEEIRADQDNVEKWRSARWAELSQNFKTLVDGPIQVIHLIPYSQTLNLVPETMREFQTLFKPAERVEGTYSGRINWHGYLTEKTFASESKLNSYVQMFRSGQLESVRVLSSEAKTIYGERTDEDLIRCIWSYMAALKQLMVPLPIAAVINFHGLKDFEMRFAGKTASQRFEFSDYGMPTITFTQWAQAATLASVAENLRPILDMLWNAAGYERSFSYRENLSWSLAKDDVVTIDGNGISWDGILKGDIVLKAATQSESGFDLMNVFGNAFEKHVPITFAVEFPWQDNRQETRMATGIVKALRRGEDYISVTIDCPESPKITMRRKRKRPTN
jgi:hypothetical protein